VPLTLSLFCCTLALLDDVKFHRSWEPYARGYIVLQIILNFAGFSAFWLPVQCGERMSLTITALLAAVASELVVASNLPSSSEMTWFQSFSLFSLAFGAIALFESAVVIYFFYYTGSDLKPAWWKWIERRASPLVNSYKQRRAARKRNNNDQEISSVQDDSIPETENGITAGVSVNATAAAESSQDLHEYDEAAPYTTAEKVRVASNSVRRRKELTNSIVRDADDFVDDLEFENNKRWKRVASKTDEVSRVFIPTTYVIALAIFLHAVEKS
jgi:hypothetical protein